MKGVQLVELPSSSHVETFTLTVVNGEDTETLSFAEGYGFEVFIPCDSLTVDRTGTYTEFTVNPDPLSNVCLSGTDYHVAAVPDAPGDMLFFACVCAWAFLVARLFS